MPKPIENAKELVDHYQFYSYLDYCLRYWTYKNNININ